MFGHSVGVGCNCAPALVSGEQRDWTRNNESSGNLSWVHLYAPACDGALGLVWQQKLERLANPSLPDGGILLDLLVEHATGDVLARDVGAPGAGDILEVCHVIVWCIRVESVDL